MSDNYPRSEEAIASALVVFLIASHPIDYTEQTFPLDQSLLDIQALDSFGVLNLIVFIEETWSIKIEDKEVTFENFLTVNVIVALILTKLS